MTCESELQELKDDHRVLDERYDLLQVMYENFKRRVREAIDKRREELCTDDCDVEGERCPWKELKKELGL